jgi:heme exporter protein C
VLRLDGSTIAPSMLWPLLVMALAFTLLFAVLHLLAMRNEILRRRIRTMRLMAAAGAPVMARPVEA